MPSPARRGVHPRLCSKGDQGGLPGAVQGGDGLVQRGLHLPGRLQVARALPLLGARRRRCPWILLVCAHNVHADHIFYQLCSRHCPVAVCLPVQRSLPAPRRCGTKCEGAGSLVMSLAAWPSARAARVVLDIFGVILSGRAQQSLWFPTLRAPRAGGAGRCRCGLRVVGRANPVLVTLCPPRAGGAGRDLRARVPGAGPRRPLLAGAHIPGHRHGPPGRAAGGQVVHRLLDGGAPRALPTPRRAFAAGDPHPEYGCHPGMRFRWTRAMAPRCARRSFVLTRSATELDALACSVDSCTDSARGPRGRRC